MAETLDADGIAGMVVAAMRKAAADFEGVLRRLEAARARDGDEVGALMEESARCAGAVEALADLGQAVSVALERDAGRNPTSKHWVH